MHAMAPPVSPRPLNVTQFFGLTRNSSSLPFGWREALGVLMHVFDAHWREGDAVPGFVAAADSSTLLSLDPAASSLYALLFLLFSYSLYKLSIFHGLVLRIARSVRFC